MPKDFTAMTDKELTATKQALEGKRVLLKEGMLKIAAEQERRIAKAKIDALSPAERDYLKQTIATENIKSTAKIHSI